MLTPPSTHSAPKRLNLLVPVFCFSPHVRRQPPRRHPSSGRPSCPQTVSTPAPPSKSATKNTKSTASTRSTSKASPPNICPYSLRILLENLLRTEDGRNVKKEDIRALAAWNKNSKPDKEIAFTPSRVLLQDFTGVPCVVDLAAMRDAMKTSAAIPPSSILCSRSNSSSTTPFRSTNSAPPPPST